MVADNAYADINVLTLDGSYIHRMLVSCTYIRWELTTRMLVSLYLYQMVTYNRYADINILILEAETI